MSTDEAVAAAVVAAARPGAAPTAVTRLSAGASRRTLLVATGAGEPLVVQVDQGAPAGGGDLRAGVAAQAELLRRAAAAGVPVPEVVLADATGDLAGAPLLVTAAVAGETVARRIQRDDAYAPARARFAADCGAALAALHRVEPGGLALTAADPLDALRDAMDATGEPRPAFELALAWLDRHRPAPSAPVLVHGDFRLGNLVVAPTGLAAVLDWELAHLGDPLEDLGWLCSVAWRFGGAAPVGGIGGREELTAAYRAAGGAPVDRSALRWWEVRACLSWGVICQRQARRHLDGTTPSMELAAIGRRVAETEWDLLGLLWPSARQAAAATASPAAAAAGGDPTGGDPTGGLHGRPTAAELVDATAMWLATDVAADAGAALSWHLRVAGHALAIVGRELRLGPAQVAAHAARLAAVGVGATDAEVAAAVRAGAAGEATDGLLDAVAAGVADRLVVADPRHLNRPLPA